MKEHDRCPFCKRRSERVSLGLSCFHCGRVAKPLRFSVFEAVILAFVLTLVVLGLTRLVTGGA